MHDFPVVIFQQIYMSVTWKLITVTKMPPAMTQLAALSVPAMLVLRVMESTVQVRVKHTMLNLDHIKQLHIGVHAFTHMHKTSPS